MADRASTVERDDDALFVKNGAPVKFCFHRSVTQGRNRIIRDVERHGGEIVMSERLANVLLVDEQEDLTFIRRRYYSSTLLHRLSLYVEPRGFVQACIRAGYYRHVRPIKQGMPGRAPGGGRVRIPFTEEDRDHLAYYLATRCPTQDGRMGNNAYKDLERLGQSGDQSWAWARQHTFHSWREHYKINSRVMDARIDRYVQRLKGVGHHFGHDPRRHDFRNLRQEEEEGSNEEENAEEDSDEEIQELDRQAYERQERARPAQAERRPDEAARDYFRRHEQDLVILDDEEEDDMQSVAIQEPQRRHDFGQTQAKQARVSGQERRASGVEAGRGEGSSAHEDTDHEGSSLEIEDSDLFGDRMYERFDFNEGMDMPQPFSPRASPVPEQDGPPLSTQATLIASPRFSAKEPTLARVPATRVVEAAPKPTVPPSPEGTLVVPQERVTARAAAAQPGPSMANETRAQGTTTAHAPYRNTRARSRLVESPPPRQTRDKGGKGKGKAKEVPVSIEEDTDAEERQGEGYAEVDVGPTPRESTEDEMAVEGLLGTSVEKDDDQDMAGEEDERDEVDEDSDDDDDMMEELPRYQVIEISGPSDSDDAETHASLARDAVQEGHDEARPDQNEGDDSDDDTDRIERMANGLLHAAPEARDARVMAATQQISPRRTRSGTQARAAAQRTEARAVQEDVKRMSPPRTRTGKRRGRGV